MYIVRALYMYSPCNVGNLNHEAVKVFVDQDYTQSPRIIQIMTKAKNNKSAKDYKIIFSHIEV